MEGEVARPGAGSGGRLAGAGQRTGGHVDAVDHDAVDTQVGHVQVGAVRRQVHRVGMRLLLPLRVDAAALVVDGREPLREVAVRGATEHRQGAAAVVGREHQLAAGVGAHVTRPGRACQYLARRGQGTVGRHAERTGGAVPAGAEVAHLVDGVQEISRLAQGEERRVVDARCHALHGQVPGIDIQLASVDALAARIAGIGADVHSHGRESTATARPAATAPPIYGPSISSGSMTSMPIWRKS